MREEAQYLVDLLRHHLRAQLYQYRAPDRDGTLYPALVQISLMRRMDQPQIELQLRLAHGHELMFTFEERMLQRCGLYRYADLLDAICDIYFEFGDVELRGRPIFRIPVREPMRWGYTELAADYAPMEMRTRNFSTPDDHRGPRDPVMSLAFDAPRRPPQPRFPLQYTEPMAIFQPPGNQHERMLLDRFWGERLREALREAMNEELDAAMTPSGWPVDPGPYESRDPINKKAWELLLEHLDQEQRKEMATHRRFFVTAPSGNRYCICYGGSFNILMQRTEQRAKKLCFTTKTKLPMGDKLLAQKLALELDEGGVLNIANPGTEVSWPR